jgi:phosphatidylserine decarboxylase
MESTVSLEVVDRTDGQPLRELVMAGQWLKRIYTSPRWRWAQPLLTRSAVVPGGYAWWQRSWLSRWTIGPFIRKHKIDTSEFEQPVESFRCFDDFFTRKLKPERRPIAPGDHVAVVPADGRYLFFETLDIELPLHIKGQALDLERLVGDKALAERYRGGTAVLARLSPVDCHRFYFPVSGVAGPTRLLPGALDSVNPLVLWRRWSILAENRRTVCSIDSKNFGIVTVCEIGATQVGTIIQTYTPNEPVQKRQEKGYFAFGGSAMLLLFEKGRIQLDPDLLELQKKSGLEVRCLIGQSLGRSET